MGNKVEPLPLEIENKKYIFGNKASCTNAKCKNYKNRLKIGRETATLSQKLSNIFAFVWLYVWINTPALSLEIGKWEVFIVTPINANIWFLSATWSPRIFMGQPWSPPCFFHPFRGRQRGPFLPAFAKSAFGPVFPGSQCKFSRLARMPRSVAYFHSFSSLFANSIYEINIVNKCELAQ